MFAYFTNLKPFQVICALTLSTSVIILSPRKFTHKYHSDLDKHSLHLLICLKLATEAELLHTFTHHSRTFPNFIMLTFYEKKNPLLNNI